MNLNLSDERWLIQYCRYAQYTLSGSLRTADQLYKKYIFQILLSPYRIQSLYHPVLSPLIQSCSCPPPSSSLSLSCWSTQPTPSKITTPYIYHLFWVGYPLKYSITATPKPAKRGEVEAWLDFLESAHLHLHFSGVMWKYDFFKTIFIPGINWSNDRS